MPEKKSEPKPWKGICSKRCWFAKGERCRCRCGKRNHGKGLKKKTDEKEDKEQKEKR